MVDRSEDRQSPLGFRSQSMEQWLLIQQSTSGIEAGRVWSQQDPSDIGVAA